MLRNQILDASSVDDSCELLYFWAFGDLHYRDRQDWRALHGPRMRMMFEDVHKVWEEEGMPAFCVSPGDIVNNGGEHNYALAKRELAAELGDHPVTHLNLMSPWYTGRGNGPYRPDPETLLYRPVRPDGQASFAVRVYSRYAVIRARDHRARAWIAQWHVPFYVA